MLASETLAELPSLTQRIEVLSVRLSGGARAGLYDPSPTLPGASYDSQEEESVADTPVDDVSGEAAGVEPGAGARRASAGTPAERTEPDAEPDADESDDAHGAERVREASTRQERGATGEPANLLPTAAAVVAEVVGVAPQPSSPPSHAELQERGCRHVGGTGDGTPRASSAASHSRISTTGSTGGRSGSQQESLRRGRAVVEALTQGPRTPVRGSTPRPADSPHQRSSPSLSWRRASSAVAMERSAVMPSVSPSQPAQPQGGVAIEGQAEVRDYVRALAHQYEGSIALWETGLGAVEVYCRKPTRTGGRPAPPRPADEGFLARIERGLCGYLGQLEDARAVLAEQATLHEDSTPVFQPRSSGERRAIAVRERWVGECEEMASMLEGYASQARGMRRRVERLRLYADVADPSGHARRSRSSVGGGACVNGGESPLRRGRSRSGTRASSRSARGASVQRGDGQLTLAKGYGGVVSVAPGAELWEVTAGSGCGSRRASVSRVDRGPGVVAPGHAVEWLGRAGTPVRSSRQGSRPASVHSPELFTPADATPPRGRDSRGASRASGRPLYMDPVMLMGSAGAAGSPYDRSTPYGQLSPVRRHSLTRPESPLPWGVLTSNGGGGGGGGGENGRRSASRQAFPRRGSEGGALVYVGDVPEPGVARGELAAVTYRSPRGHVEPAGAAPVLPDTTRRQLLLTIDYFETHVAALRKADLKTARDCFVRLYGERGGLRQYRGWLDELTLQALRLNR